MTMLHINLVNRTYVSFQVLVLSFILFNIFIRDNLKKFLHCYIGLSSVNLTVEQGYTEKFKEILIGLFH